MMRKINYKLGLQFQDAGGREAGRGMLVQQSLPQHGPDKGQIFFPKTQGGAHQEVEMASVPAGGTVGARSATPCLSGHLIASPVSLPSFLFFLPNTCGPCLDTNDLKISGTP